MSDADKINILVVDDIPDKLLSIRTILEELGHNVVCVDSGRAALRQLLDQDFAVILLDVNMPDMDGFETAALIRQRRRSAQTPIIFITAFGDDMYVARGYSLGAVDYILSPVVPDVLRSKVRVFAELYQKTEQVKQQAQAQVALAREQAARAAAEETTRRSNFLAEASNVLGSSLDYEQTVRALPRLAVPYLADAAGVTQAGESGRPWRSELAWAHPPDPAVHTRSLTAPEGPQDDLRAAVERVLAAGKAETLEGLDVVYPPTEGEAAPPPSQPRLHAAVVLPLLARGRTLGALTLGSAGRRFTAADLALAEDLASRAAIALDNARLYRDIQEADRRKNEFLAMLAHELRNPLAPVRNAVQILRLAGNDPTKVRWAQEVIDRQVQHLVRMVDDLLDISRITRGTIVLRPEPVEVAAVVERAVEISRPLLEARRHELTLALPGEPLRLVADPARLAQVLANLLNNAAKYTPEGGHVWLSAAAENGDVVLRVRDSGIGIPPNMLTEVFEPFTQVDHSIDRTQGGLGIGLTLVRRLVELHKGNVQAFSPGLNQGSEFVVRLPCLEEGPARDAGSAPGCLARNGDDKNGKEGSRPGVPVGKHG